MRPNHFNRKLSSAAKNIARTFDNTEHNKKRDYAWNGRKNNPLFSTKKKKDWGLLLKILCILITLLATLLITLSHSFFTIREVKIQGISRINIHELQDTVSGILDEKVFGFFSSRNYFLADTADIRDILMIKYPIAEIIVKKVYPNNMSIELKEKINRIIFDNGHRFAYLNETGQILEIIRSVGGDEWQNQTNIDTDQADLIETTSSTTSTLQTTILVNKIHRPSTNDLRNEAGDYPILYDARFANTSTPSLEKGMDAIDAKYVTALIAWYQDLVCIVDNNKIDYFELQNDIGFSVVKLQTGSSIKINLIDDRTGAIEAIDLLLQEKIKGGKFEYIDVRYPGRVYWK